MNLQAYIFLPLLMVSLSFGQVARAGPEETAKLVLAALSAGDAQALSGHLNKMIDLGIPGSEGTYSNTQATRILQDFFRKNPVVSVKITKQGDSADGSYFSLGEMKAGGKTYRVYYLLKSVDGEYKVQLLQIHEPG